VIEPSRSAWRSPIVLVPKPDGTTRFCIDYRELNKVAQFDAYPMPRADVLVDHLGSARYLSALDLTKGYWQVPVRPADREKTAFATPRGLFQFKKMPFGLHGAAATFQRLVIEPSRSAWRSPIVLVPKPDGTTRFCIDYRELNKVAQFDAYPMPRADVLVDHLGSARYLSALDLTKGYWQVPVRPADREKTAFATPRGLFQFKKMPFGLHGAAATFQRLEQVSVVMCLDLGDPGPINFSQPHLPHKVGVI
ncbi:uncharacterized protein K02A2.6-like, partial [Eublepharis macularius]|uniref:Uncharacterized protein K02A2.6-like n=1 Tax=Eublepharis macularius TaxID=481883 RepID=A0AA97K0N4_EUBMA